MKSNKRVCVVGAGPSGIAAAKNCVEYGIDVVVFEKNDKVGGNWVFNSKTGHSSVYENTHIISSKVWSEYEDFPMPEEYPDYPNHKQLQAYFESYAKHFGVYNKIRFNHSIKKISRTEDGDWRVEFTDSKGKNKVENFDFLMIANGHHWDPKYPTYEGKFTGKFMHSHDFKGVTEDWRGKDVLIIGGGNSACDVAVESARLAKSVKLSMRSPQWFFPKFLFGMPSDVFAAMTPSWIPAKIKQYVLTKLLYVLQGSYKNYGLPVNTAPALSHHPTLNSDLLDFIRHGRIKPRPAIKAFHGKSVEFMDGTEEKFDIICACTGFWTTFPFFDKSFIDFQYAEKIPLYRKMMHPDYKNLYFIGLFQPVGCIWPMADYQAKLACMEILEKYERPKNLKAEIQYEIDHPHFSFGGGQRHAVEVDYHGFRKDLKSDLAKAGIDIGKPPAGRKGFYKSFFKVASKEPVALSR
ncbi:monooxygenase [Leptospira fluminis]|uniref:Monooxygenase n=1 Tax=Leptospira fluminis TaxID=2484979 RepID=A0A4R9GQU2_9LEPT|nr:NAD(P)-binding domain-containing protein [Leptospira fluminis]TGK19410.1 monooxygenase [Leptospira fluminis]